MVDSGVVSRSPRPYNRNLLRKNRTCEMKATVMLLENIDITSSRETAEVRKATKTK